MTETEKAEIYIAVMLIFFIGFIIGVVTGAAVG